nr:zinc finger, CCHC-type [Tanacetum cinerariifolium]
MEWYRNLRIVLSVEDKLPFLEQPIPTMPVPPAGQVTPSDVLATHSTWVKAQTEIAGLMLMTMDLDIQKNLEHLGAFDMLKKLKTLKTKKKSHKAAKGNQWKGKAKMGYAPVQAPPFAPKPKNPPTPKKDNPAKDAICHQCGEGLRGSKKLKPGALSLCHYAPSITRGIISVLHLYKDGFINRFENDNSIYVSKNNLIYFNVIPRDDIYEIVLSSSNTNDSSIKKRIEKLQHDGLLDSTDIKSFEKYVSCMYGKMARKPYSHQVERATDLPGLIHTDEVENQLGKTIKSLRSGRGGDYMIQEFLDHLKKHGIITHRTPPYTPQHNGYPKETMGYSFYYPPEKNVFVAWNVEFFENDIIDQDASGSLEDLEIIQEEDTHPSIDISLNHEDDD